MTYKVLWIDDVQNEEFIIEAESYDLDIEQKLCYNDGIAWLKENRDFCSAVILDVNCKISAGDDEAPSITAFSNCFHKIINMCSAERGQIPWFVYTAGDYDGVSMLDNFLPADLPWLEGKKYYSKPADRKELLSAIKRFVYVSDFVKIIDAYKDIFTAFPEKKERLLKLINGGIIQNNSKDASLLNESRKMLEYMMNYMRNHGLFPEHVNTLSNTQYYLGQIARKNELLVPKYISWGFTLCIETTQNGSHESQSPESVEPKLTVDAEVSAGKYPYMIRSIVYELLHLLSWIKTLPQSSDDIQALREKIKSLEIIDRNEIKK